MLNIRKILLFDEFLASWDAIKREKWRYLFLFFQFVIFCGRWKYSFTDTLLVINCALCGCIAIYYGVEWKNIIYVMLIYVAMIFVPIWMYGMDDIMFRQYVGYAIRILTGCFIASYFRYDFISKFENLVFVLAYISIPLFILQIINPHIFDIFTPLTHALQGGNEFILNGKKYFNQYFLIYYQHGTAYTRNSGFTWEPGAYAMMLNWALLFCMFRTRFCWHKRFVIYIIAMITTFSLMGYTCSFILLIMFLMQNSDLKKIGYTIVGGGVLLLVLMQTSLFKSQQEMMLSKANMYAENSKGELDDGIMYLNEKSTTKRVGRIAQFYLLKDIIYEAPFGRGMAEWKYDSSNGLIDLIVKWGINILLILMVSFYYFTRRLAQMMRLKLNWYIVIMSMIILIMPAISNPVYNRVFFMAMITFPMFAKRQI